MTLSASERAAIETALESLGPALRRALARRFPSGCGVDFDELEQEARIRLWRALEREKEIDSPASYVARIAVSVTIDAVRRIKTRREEPLTAAGDDPDGGGPSREAEEPSISPERHAELAELRERVNAALARLAPDRRRAVRFHLQGFTPVEIGRLCDWSEARGRNLVYRGLADLREELEKEGIEGA